MEPTMFEDVADVLRAALPRDLGEVHCQARRYGVKVWLGGPVDPPKEHYEAQVLGRRHVPEAKVLAVEIGWHAEHPKPALNEAALAGLLGAEKKWRAKLGAEAVAGPFLGRDSWRRISEAWPDPDLSGADAIFEIADRLADYITALEPHRP
jgi:hypothetical protein